METAKKASPKRDLMRYKLIRQSFIMHGRTMSGLACELGVSPALVTMVARGQRRQKRVQDALAAVVGIERSELWS